MATGSSPLESVTIDSYIRGYHAYKEIWIPTAGEELLLRREPDNIDDQYAVAVTKDGEIVGHVPFNLARTVCQFLRGDYNSAFAEVTGNYLNRGAGYGLEVTCVYKFFGPGPWSVVLCFVTVGRAIRIR